MLVGALAEEGQTVAVALAERAVPCRVVGAEAFFERTEIRDVLAWLRLLVDPRDAPAVVRALARPPIELPSADIARCVQIARRRRIDMVAALVRRRPSRRSSRPRRASGSSSSCAYTAPPPTRSTAPAPTSSCTS